MTYKITNDVALYLPSSEAVLAAEALTDSRVGLIPSRSIGLLISRKGKQDGNRDLERKLSKGEASRRTYVLSAKRAVHIAQIRGIGRHT